MDKQNAKLVTAASIGAVAGVLIGSYLWGDDKKNKELSKNVKKVFDLLKELEKNELLTSEKIKEVISNLSDKVQTDIVESLSESNKKSTTDEKS